MILTTPKILFLFLFVFLGVSLVSAQDASEKKPDLTRGMDLPDTMKENLAKIRQKAEEEEYKELIKKSEEAAKLSEELTASYEVANKFSDEDAKKLDRLEKVVKKIRQDLGGEDEKESVDSEKPSTLINMLNNIKDKTSDLLKELKKTTRYSVSVVAIESSNSLLRLVRFIKFSKK